MYVSTIHFQPICVTGILKIQEMQPLEYLHLNHLESIIITCVLFPSGPAEGRLRQRRHQLLLHDGARPDDL